ncbi:MAG: tRNA-dihydrouridine synthase [Deltaproteobacteria bacterium]|nr:tRNA-dihydrouridine synthase [Deltaproteobacteria bacterium]
MLLGSHSIAPSFILAPLAGYTDLTFRLLARSLGCGLAYTEMVSAEGLSRRASGTWELLEKDPADHPVSVQLFGSRPDSLARAAALVEEWGADIIDLNLGCPVKQVVKTGSGAALLKDPARTLHLLREVRRAVSVPLTVKIRSGWQPGEPTGLTIAAMAEDCGYAAVALHPRWAVQGFTGLADWGLVALLKQKITIPVIGNGDLQNAEQALARQQETGCDGLMIGRQALKAPWIFRQMAELTAGRPLLEPDRAERKKIIADYWDRIAGRYEGVRQVKALRRALFVLTRGLTGSGHFRQQVALAPTAAVLQELFEQFFSGPEMDN